MASLETVYEADSSLEAAVIENLLKSNGIECTTRNVGLPGVFGGGGTNPALEQYQVQVHAERKKDAEQMILDYQSPDDQ